MKDFASYDRGKKKSGPISSADWEKEIRDMAAEYDKKGEGALVKEIFSRAAEGRRNGTLTDAQIDLFYRQFAPSLDEAKRKKLLALVQRLKEM